MYIFYNYLQLSTVARLGNSEQRFHLSIRHDDLIASPISEIAIANTESGTVHIRKNFFKNNKRYGMDNYIF